ncbi:MAG: aldo/keto reductase [Flavisolibacter sp.]
MQKRKIGNSDLSIAPFVLGGNVFGWTIDESTSFQVLDAFIETGCEMIDTADVYSNWKEGNKGGESETIIGNWMQKRGNRSKVLIATKVGGDMGQGKNLKKDYIMKAVEASLKRLQTDYIDLYQSHWDDITTPVDETLEAYSQLIKDGKLRYIGASNLSKERLEDSLNASKKNNLPRYQSLQPRYNLYDREEFETQYQQICIRENLAVLPYYGLASGFLTGKYRSAKDLSKSARGGGIQKYLTPRGLKILDTLDSIASRYQTRPATIALAWLMAKPAITAPIASATNTDQLEDLVKAVDLHLDDEAMQLLDEL